MGTTATDSAGLMELVLESVAQARSGAAHDCRRRAARFGIAGKVALIPLGAKSRLFAEPARVRDVSASGICIVAPRDVPAGSRFVLRLERREPAAPANAIVCESLHSRPIDASAFRIGARFLGRAA